MPRIVSHRNRVTEVRLRAASAALAFVLGLVTVVGISSAEAQTYKETVLYHFTWGADGAQPYGGLILDAKGNLYGTTFFGGALPCNSGRGCGVVFKVNSKDKETVLHSFTGADGDGTDPYAGLVEDAGGNLYGTTYAGGNLSDCNGSGCGVVFKLDPATSTETVLHSFTGGADGGNPYAGLILDAKGNLYGTTLTGGAYGYGVVFKINSKEKETVLHSFTGGADGGNPYAGLILDAKGNLYGTTYTGGAAGDGVVFKINSKDKETVLHSFTGGADGARPFGGLILDAKGNLYGTTYTGGAAGDGVVFKINSKEKETVLHSFTGGADGEYPYGGVVRDAAGNLYGTTEFGGAYGNGAVFKVNSKEKETVLYSFAGGEDGKNPYAGLILDAMGNLYGTTEGGGGGGGFNSGIVFKVTP